MIRLLIITPRDDRMRLLAGSLDELADLAVSGIARDLHNAMVQLNRGQHQAVILDVESPEAVAIRDELGAWDKHLPVVFVGSTLDSARWPACVRLPDGPLDPDDPLASAAVGRVAKALQQLRGDSADARPVAPASARNNGTSGDFAGPPPVSRPSGSRIELVAIGASTGGPRALTEVLTRLGRDFPVPIVIAQHMPPKFTESFAEQLQARCHLDVRLAHDGTSITGGHAYLAPGNHHMLVAADGDHVRLRLHSGPAINSCRPSVDVLFKSAAEVYGSRVLAVILTGMGRDGVDGCRSIHEVGGPVIAQDEATSAIWGMPGFVSDENLAHQVLALDQIAEAVAHHCKVAGACPALPLTD